MITRLQCWYVTLILLFVATYVTCEFMYLVAQKFHCQVVTIFNLLIACGYVLCVNLGSILPANVPRVPSQSSLACMQRVLRTIFCQILCLACIFAYKLFHFHRRFLDSWVPSVHNYYLI